MRNKMICLAAASLSLAVLAGCDSMPWDHKAKGDVKDDNSPPAQKNVNNASTPDNREMGTTTAPIKDENDKMPMK